MKHCQIMVVSGLMEDLQAITGILVHELSTSGYFPGTRSPFILGTGSVVIVTA